MIMDAIKEKSSGFSDKKAWLVTINMGYGHQRTAHPLKDLAFGGEIINANDYPQIPGEDRQIWERSRNFYEFISRFKRFPLIGSLFFSIYDYFQKILSYYPKRDLSKPTLTLKQLYSLIRRGWGKDLISRLSSDNFSKPLPLISTFFTPAFMAEVFNYPGEIFCVVCDADISRSWAPLKPRESRIKYLASTSWSASRLKLYGVKEENVFLTGYPLPLENIGTEKMEILKFDLSYRLLNLDPQKTYSQKYSSLINEYLGPSPSRPNHPLTLMFSVGGAGCQKEIGMEAIKSLKEKIGRGEIRVILSAGIRKKVRDYFLENIRRTGLEPGRGIEILYRDKTEDYFKEFNVKLRTADILWTKPSELSFYSALGLPILIAPTIGSQEDFNRKWLLKLGAGILQENPKHIHQWLFFFLFSGRFAESAMQGFVEAEKLGTLNIQKIITT